MRKTTIAVASTNPVKINAAKAGFELMFPDKDFQATGFAISSGVSDQPMTAHETLLGATNRALRLREHEPDADFCVGIEGGIEKIDGTMFANAWVVINDKDQKIARGRSGSFALPPRVQTLVESGMELGLANDEVFSKHDSKRAGGAVGSLTDGVITRQSLYEHAVSLALIACRQTELFAAI